jgi:hypothetical protein
MVRPHDGPPVVSSNWTGVIFGTVVSAVKELNNLRQNHWKIKVSELGWSVLIGVCAWIALAMVNATYLVYADHGASSATIKSQAREISSLKNQPTAKPVIIIQQVPLPRDPLLMPADAPLSMISGIKKAIQDQLPIGFLVGAAPGNERPKSLIEGILMDVCSSADAAREARLQCTVQSSAPQTPVSGHQVLLSMLINQWNCLAKNH